MEKTIVLIPAFNEELNLPHAVQLLRTSGISSEILVVNDGSTDKTSEIAGKLGCTVIDLPKNVGKANAFFAGIREAVKRNASCVVTIDADLIQLNHHAFNEMAKVSEKANVEKKPLMAVAEQGEVHENNYSAIEQTSGFRAYNRQALHLIDSAKSKGQVKRFGLEAFLNKLFEDKIAKVKWEFPPFLTKKPFRNSTGRRQFEEVKKTENRLTKRLRHGRRL